MKQENAPFIAKIISDGNPLGIVFEEGLFAGTLMDDMVKINYFTADRGQADSIGFISVNLHNRIKYELRKIKIKGLD